MLQRKYRGEVIETRCSLPPPWHFKSESCYLRCLASAASGKNAVRFLSISAAVVDISVRETSVPHHDTTESSVVAVLGDESGKVCRCKVVLSTRCSARGTVLRSRDTEEDLSSGRRGSCDVGDPVVEVGAGVGGAAFVIVELDPEVVELRVGDDFLHVGFGDGALRRAGDVVGVRWIIGEVGAECGYHVLVILVSRVGLQVKVESVDEGVAEGAGNSGGGGGAGCVGATVSCPQVLADGGSLILRAKRVGTRSATERQDDLDAVRLASRDSGSQVIAVLACAISPDVARLANGTRGDGDTVAPFVQESEDDDVNSSISGTVSGEIVVLDGASTVLAPVNDILGTAGLTLSCAEAVQDVRIGHGSGSHKTSAGNS